MAKQAEFVGRAEALEKVDLRARVQGFLGSRLFKEATGQENQVVFTIESEPFEVRSISESAARLRGGEFDQRRTTIAARTRARSGRAMTIPPPNSTRDRRTVIKPRVRSWRPRPTCAKAEIELSYTEIKIADRWPHRPSCGIPRQLGRARYRNPRDDRAGGPDAGPVFGHASARYSKPGATGGRPGR